MGLALGGLQSGGASASSIIASLVGQDIVARSFTSTQASGSDGFAATVTGARWHIGPGTTDYFTSDGSTRITAAGVLAAAASLEVPTNGFLYLNGTTRTIGFTDTGTALVVTGAEPLTPSSDQGINLGSPSVRWSNLYATGINLGPAGILTFSATAPTISSGFGAGASVVSGGAACFRINCGAAAQTGVIGLPAAANGWMVTAHNITTPASNIIEQTAFTTTTASLQNYARATGLAANWTANDIIVCTATAF